jgi:hypothetical protein
MLAACFLLAAIAFSVRTSVADHARRFDLLDIVIPPSGKKTATLVTASAEKTSESERVGAFFKWKTGTPIAEKASQWDGFGARPVCISSVLYGLGLTARAVSAAGLRVAPDLPRHPATDPSF